MTTLHPITQSAAVHGLGLITPPRPAPEPDADAWIRVRHEVGTLGLGGLLAAAYEDGAVRLADDQADDVADFQLTAATVAIEIEAAVLEMLELIESHDGQAAQQTMLLHAYGRPKPWQPNAWRNLRRTAYVRCLRLLLNRSDTPVRVDTRTLPVWLRPDARGAVILHLLFGISWIRRRVAGAGRWIGAGMSQ